MTSGYFRLPQYRPVDVTRTPYRPQCRLANVYPPQSQFPPKCPASVHRCCTPLAQFCGSPSPPYPLVHPTFFDVPRSHSGWAVRRCQHALSPTIEEMSPASGSPTTTTPVSRHPAYSNYFQWDHQNVGCSKAGDGLHQCSDEGRWSVESSSDHRDQFLAPAVPWSSTTACSDQPSGVGNTASFHQSPLTTQWHALRGRHTRRETF